MPDRYKGASFLLDQPDAEILLEERDAAVHAFLEPRGLRFGVGCRRGVGVEADAIAEPAAEQLPARHAPGLAGEVHQGHLDAADAAGLPRRRPELLDAPENLVDVARVLAEDPALQHQRVAFVAPVAHFAPADQPLVRIDADDGHRERGARHDRHAQIGDLQRRRFGRAIDVRLHEIGGRGRGRFTRHRDRGAGPDSEALEERSPIDRRVTVVEECTDSGFHTESPFRYPDVPDLRRRGAAQDRKRVATSQGTGVEFVKAR